MKRLAKFTWFLICLLYSWAACAGMERVPPSVTINSHRFERLDEEVPALATDRVESDNIPQTSVFTPEEGEGMARAARIEAGKAARVRAQEGVEYCFQLMQEAAKAGECSAAFFAEDAACNGDQEASGCFENKVWRRKVGRLGFSLRRQELPTDDTEDHCATVTVSWCRDLRKGGRR